MDLQSLFHIQNELDQKIIEEHGLKNRDLFSSKILAFQVELGELANETRCFKFWSKKKPSSHEVILEEFADGFHFLLSIGLDCGFILKELAPEHNIKGVEEQLHSVFISAGLFYQRSTIENYINLFNSFLLLGYKLNFTDEEISHAYMEKNQINRKRQAEGY